MIEIGKLVGILKLLPVWGQALEFEKNGTSNGLESSPKLEFQFVSVGVSKITLGVAFF